MDFYLYSIGIYHKTSQLKMKGKTLIIVAHRLQSIQNVDKIVVFRGGIIESVGNFSHLMNNCNYFKELWNSTAIEKDKNSKNYEGE